MPDEQLLLLARRDDAAFEVLIRRHAPRVHALAASLVGAGSADDVVQEVFLSAHKSLKSFRGDALFTTWLHRVALNACYKMLRAKPTLSYEDVPELTATSDPVQAGEVAVLRERLAWAMGRLPDKQREVLALRELADLDYAEIAQTLKVPLGTVKSRVARGRAALKELLIREGITP